MQWRHKSFMLPRLLLVALLACVTVLGYTSARNLSLHTGVRAALKNEVRQHSALLAALGIKRRGTGQSAGTARAPSADTTVNAVASAATSTDRVIVDPKAVVRTIPSDFFGINYVGFWDLAQGSAGSAKALAQTPIKTVRFPGGAPADWYDWQDPHYKDWSLTSPMELWHYARSFGATHVRFGTNIQGNLPNPPGKSYAVNSPENAAAWVQYNKQNGIRASMEVGNEEDLKTMHKADDPAYAPYIAAFNAQAKAMHQADPHVRVLGPVQANEYYWWALGGLGTFLKSAGNRTGTGQVDGISLHFYKGGSWYDTKGVAQYWLWSQGPWAAVQKTIREHDTRHLPVYLTEWNPGGSDQNSSFNATVGHALVTTDMLGALALSGVAGEDYFDIHGGHSWGLLYGKGEDRPLDSPTPTYYSMALWNHMGKRMVRLVQSDDPSTVMSTYATAGRNGSVQVLAINKGSSAHNVSIQLNGANPAGHHLHVYTLGSPTGTVDDLDATYNGAKMPSPQQRLPGPKNAGVVRGRTLTYRVPAYSAVVLDVDGTSPAPRMQHVKPFPAPPPPPKLEISTKGTVERTSLKGGDAQTVTAVVQSNDDIGPAIIDLEVYDSANIRVFQATPTLNLMANKPVTVTRTFTLPATAYGGTYHYKIGVFGPNWSPTLTWNDGGGSFTVEGPNPPSVSVTGQVNPTHIKAGDTVTFSADVRSAHGPLAGALLDIEVYSLAGAKVCQRVTTGIDIPADQTKHVVDQCTIPSDQASGTYVVKMGVFGSDWKPLYVWNDNAAAITVG